jgi:glycerophosphoryl diester phosphodiesterase
VKSNDPQEGRRLADALAKLALERQQSLIVYGGDRPVQEVKARLPDVTILSRQTLEACLYRYIGYGWTGLVPAECRNAESIRVPSRSRRTE